MPARKSPKRSKAPVSLDGETLSPEAVERIADGGSCRLAVAARKRIRASRRTVTHATRGGRQVYGVNTGFGKLARVRIDDADLGALQQNLVRSHAAGVGAPYDERTVRAVMALRANCLARGHSGIRLATVERILEMLDAGIHPVIPEQGSVGASGDLAPLAHLALAVIGEGEVFYKRKRVPASRALKRADLEPIRLEAKEGLALVNGTQVMSAIGVLTLLRAERLATMADLAGAMSLEALLGSHRAFDPRIQLARPHPGQLTSALNLRRLLADSEIERSHEGCGRVQDSYSLRCIPQVHGAVRDALAHVRWVLQVEINASTDNPMVFADEDDLVSGGNFHGQPLALALDHLGTSVCSLASISERRTDRLMSPDLSAGLPPFLAHDPGLHSGFMLAQVTAAALVSENKVLAHPASVDSITTSASKEDHVSMGVTAARQARQIVDHVATVLAIEVLCATQALDLRRPLEAGRGVEAARRAVRKRIPHLREDRVLAPDIERARRIVEDGTLRQAVEAEIGPLV
jgi:histidine ammonia-lyase